MASDEVSSHHASDRSSEVNTEESDTSETEAAIGESSCSSSGKFRSDVWKYFTKCASRKRALCHLCNKEYAYLGATSNLRDHLQRYHKDKYRVKSDFNGTERNTVTIDSFLSRAKCPVTRAKRITELIALMVAKDLRPAAVVEGEGFKRLLSYLEPGYTIPSSVHVMDIVRRKFLAAKEKLGEILSANESKYGITTDIWTSFSNDAYISLTLHFIDNSWELKSYTLATYPFPEQHTGDNIVEKLKEVIKEYNITDDKVAAIVHDQGSNFQRAGRVLAEEKKWKSVNCAAHCLQLCVVEGFGINTIAQALGAAKSLVKHFHHSARATEELHKRQESMNQPRRKLINECKTRWNSTFYMCESLLENRWPISAVLADESVTKVEHRRLDLTSTQWELLSDLVKILQPLEIGTTYMCSETSASLSAILPILFGIIKHLEIKESDSAVIKRFKICVECQIRTRWGLDEINATDINVLASALDPRYKSLKFLDAEKISEIKTELEDQINQLTCDGEANSSSLSSASQIIPPPAKKKVLDILFGQEERNPSVLTDEVELYFSENSIPRNFNPLQWWKANSLRYPRLSQLVKPLFAIPATSTASERLFSVAGLTVTRLRSHLNRENVNALVFLHNNYHLIC